MTKSTHSYDAPARSAFSIVPNDLIDFATATRGIVVGSGGTLMAVFVDQSTPVSLTVGQGFYPFAVRRILATGTTANALVGVY